MVQLRLSFESDTYKGSYIAENGVGKVDVFCVSYLLKTLDANQ